MTTKTKRAKAKKGAWFVPIRGSYLPASSAGWWTYLPFVAYLVISVVIGLKDVNSKAVAVLFIIPNWVAASVVMTYVASKKS